jgi:hypothetical protein
VKRVLLDHCVPRRVRNAIAGHQVATTYEQGWSELKNGELLRAAITAKFDVFVTADKNLRHQQNLARPELGIVLLPTNTLQDLLPLFHKIADAVDRAQPGKLRGSDLTAKGEALRSLRNITVCVASQ